VNGKQWRRKQVAEREQAAFARRDAIEARRMRHGARPLDPECLAAYQALREIYHAHSRIPASIRCIDGFSSDLAVLVDKMPEHVDPANQRMGGELEWLGPSPLALPLSLVIAAENTPEYRMGSFKPLLTAANGEARYLVPSCGLFFQGAGIRGCDLDPDAALNPREDDARADRYVWSEIQDQDLVYVEIGEL
jgi:hypothetical protein